MNEKIAASRAPAVALRHSSAQITYAFAISRRSLPAELPQWPFAMALRGSPTSPRYNQERPCLGWSCLKLLSQFGIRLVLTLTFSKSITASCSPRPGSTRWFCRHNSHWQFGIRGSRHWPSMAIRMASYRGRVRSKVVDPMILFAVLPSARWSSSAPWLRALGQRGSCWAFEGNIRDTKTAIDGATEFTGAFNSEIEVRQWL